ncbi:MAG TPA: acyl-CoA thioester hydrolase/BAAT C-terminal domain-containing protein [Thermoplasmata archaeon]|nr:acyl-CoA thioester hydrolase/BAAT C-terminal domain-containing protein [Thermoplasmata archaeon]
MAVVDRSQLTLAADGVIGTLFAPRTPDRVPGVVLIGGSGGQEPQLSAMRLAQEGFAALSVAYFKRDGLPPTLREVPLEYFEQALQALRRSLHLGRGPLAVLGVSRGSEAALLSGVHFPDLVNAVVAMVPGNVVLCSWPPGGPAWTLRGRPLPYTSRFGPATDNPEAEIPVERIQGPVLLISAGADRVWPSSRMAFAMAARLKAKGHPYPDEHIDYPVAGHDLGQGEARPAPEGTSGPFEGVVQDGSARRSPLDEVCNFLRRLR